MSAAQQLYSFITHFWSPPIIFIFI